MYNIYYIYYTQPANYRKKLIAISTLSKSAITPPFNISSVSPEKMYYYNVYSTLSTTQRQTREEPPDIPYIVRSWTKERNPIPGAFYGSATWPPGGNTEESGEWRTLEDGTRLWTDQYSTVYSEKIAGPIDPAKVTTTFDYAPIAQIGFIKTPELYSMSTIKEKSTAPLVFKYQSKFLPRKYIGNYTISELPLMPEDTKVPGTLGPQMLIRSGIVDSTGKPVVIGSFGPGAILRLFSNGFEAYLRMTDGYNADSYWAAIYTGWPDDEVMVLGYCGKPPSLMGLSFKNGPSFKCITMNEAPRVLRTITASSGTANSYCAIIDAQVWLATYNRAETTLTWHLAPHQIFENDHACTITIPLPRIIHLVMYSTVQYVMISVVRTDAVVAWRMELHGLNGSICRNSAKLIEVDENTYRFVFAIGESNQSGPSEMRYISFEWDHTLPDAEKTLISLISNSQMRTWRSAAPFSDAWPVYGGTAFLNTDLTSFTISLYDDNGWFQYDKITQFSDTTESPPQCFHWSGSGKLETKPGAPANLVYVMISGAEETHTSGGDLIYLMDYPYIYVYDMSLDHIVLKDTILPYTCKDDKIYARVEAPIHNIGSDATPQDGRPGYTRKFTDPTKNTGLTIVKPPLQGGILIASGLNDVTLR